MNISSMISDEKKMYKFALFLIVVFSILIRLKYFGLHRFTMDEALYAGWAHRVFSKLDILFNGVSEMDKPPVLFYMQAICYALFGVSENAARIPNFVAGIANVVLVYKIGKHYFNQYCGLIAAFLLAVSPYCIAYDNSAYTDTLNVFFGLLSIYLVSITNYFYAGVAIALAFGTKQFGILFLPLTVIAVYLNAFFYKGNKFELWSSEIKAFLKGFGWVTLGLIFISLFSNPPLGFLVEGFGNQSQLVEEAKEPLLTRYLMWFNILRDTFWLNGPKDLFLLLIPITSIYFGFKAMGKHMTEGVGLYLAALLYVVVFISMMSIVRFEFYPRYLTMIAPFVFVLVAVPLSFVLKLVYEKISPKWLGKIVLIIMVLMLSMILINDVRNLPNPKLKDGAFFDVHDGIDDVAWFIKNKLPKRPILFTCENPTTWALKFYCYGYEFEKIMWVTNAEQIKKLSDQFPGSAKYMLWRGKDNGFYEEMLKQAGMINERVFEAHAGHNNDVNFSILKLVKEKSEGVVLQ